MPAARQEKALRTAPAEGPGPQRLFDAVLCDSTFHDILRKGFDGAGSGTSHRPRTLPPAIPGQGRIFQTRSFYYITPDDALPRRNDAVREGAAFHERERCVIVCHKRLKGKG
jgi:hypothetical protein